MRTTLTLDDDVAARIEEIRTREQKSLKQVVNDLLRKGILLDRKTIKSKERYETPELSAGKSRFPDLDNVAEILSVAEEEEYR